MTADATQLMAEALRVVDLSGSFSPAVLGAKLGLPRSRAEAAARELSNNGVLVLGFDFAAEFSPDFRKSRAPVKESAVKPKRARRVGQKA